MSDTLCIKNSGYFQYVRLQCIKNASGMSIEASPKWRGIRGGIYSLQKDNWVFKVSYLNLTRFDILGELFEQVYE